MITPLKSNDELDRDGVEKLIEHIIGGGVHGLFLLGTNGEGPSLSNRLKKEFLKLSCEVVKGRVPVLVGITDSAFSGAMEIAEYSKSVGADSVVVAPPFYFPANETEMINYVEKLAAATPLPFVLYNMPMHTKINLTIPTIRRAKELGCIGVKDSSGDMANLYMWIDAFKEDQNFAVFAGTELYLPDAVMGGAHGAVAGGANVFPKLFVDLYEAALKQDLPTINKLRDKIIWLCNTMYVVSPSAARITISFKTALSLLGICSDEMALPLMKLEGADKEQIATYLKEMKEFI
ncbi:MAG: dihydrodipicolinate synthase family protein [Marinilabiliales bacterium]|nr:dihydrodipicolinate synthase family protein [Marinilabiliales bacterium]